MFHWEPCKSFYSTFLSFARCRKQRTGLADPRFRPTEQRLKKKKDSGQRRPSRVARDGAGAPPQCAAPVGGLSFAEGGPQRRGRVCWRSAAAAATVAGEAALQAREEERKGLEDERRRRALRAQLRPWRVGCRETRESEREWEEGSRGQRPVSKSRARGEVAVMKASDLHLPSVGHARLCRFDREAHGQTVDSTESCFSSCSQCMWQQIKVLCYGL